MPDPLFHIFATPAQLARAAAEFFVDQARAAIAARGRFVVCLSGGSTPEAMFRLLAEDEMRDKVDWGRVFVFFGDERHVPADSDRNNARMARTTLLDPVGLPGSHVFAIDTRYEPEIAAQRYAQTLRDFFGDAPPAFDLLWLGLGDDGHTASLFPGTEVVHETEAWVRAVYVPQHDDWRISLTAPLLVQAREIAFLVKGAGKAEAVEAVLNGAYEPEQYPAQLVTRHATDVRWFLDEAAAG